MFSEFLGGIAALLIKAFTGLPSRNLFKSNKVLSREIQKQSLQNVFDLETQLFPCLLDMKFKGVRVDIEKAKLLKQQLTKQEQEILLKVKKPNWRTIRQIVADSNVKDFEGLYRFLYDNSSEYASGKEGMIAFYVNEYSYQSNFRIDKEVNCMALMSKIIETIKPNII